MKIYGTNRMIQLCGAIIVAVCVAGVSGAQTADEAYFAAVEKLQAEGFAGVDGALAAFEGIVRDNPGHVFSRLGAADALLLKYEFGKDKDKALLDRAMAHLDAAARADADLPEVYFKRASVLFNLGEDAKAVADLEKSMELLPEYADARIMYLQYLLSEGKKKEAKKFAEESVAVAPEDPAAAKLLGDVFLREGAYKEAIGLYRRVIALADRAPYTNLAIGQAYQGLGEHGKAVKAFRAAIEQAPDVDEAGFGLGVSLSETGKYDEAVEIFEEYLEKHPGNVSAMNNLALLYEKKGQIPKAKLMWLKVKQAGGAEVYREKAERRLFSMISPDSEAPAGGL